MSDDREQLLDQLLAQARWPEPSAEVGARLSATYRSARHRNWARIWRIGAVAASIIFVSGMFLILPSHPASKTIRQPSIIQAALSPRLIVREPTPLETVMFETKLRKPQKFDENRQNSAVSENTDLARRPPAIRPAAPSQPPSPVAKANAIPADSVRQWLRDISDPARCGAALAAIDHLKDPPVDALIAALGDPLVDNRLAAARVLGHLDGPVITRRLVDMAERNDHRREAMIALASSRGPEAREFVQRASKSGPLVSVARSILAEPEFSRQ